MFSEIFTAAVANDRHRALLAEADAYRLALAVALAPRVRTRLVRLAALVRRGSSDPGRQGGHREVDHRVVAGTPDRSEPQLVAQAVEGVVVGACLRP